MEKSIEREDYLPWLVSHNSKFRLGMFMLIYKKTKKSK